MVYPARKRSECGAEKAADPMRKRRAFDGEKAVDPPADNTKQSPCIYDTMDASRSARSADGQDEKHRHSKEERE